MEDLTAYRVRTTAELSNREHSSIENSGDSAAKEPQKTPEPQGQLPTPFSTPATAPISHEPDVFPAGNPNPLSSINEEDQQETVLHEDRQSEPSPNDQLQQELDLISTVNKEIEETVPPVAPRDINSQLDISNILETRRIRRSTHDPSYKSYHAGLISLEDEDPRPLRQAYTAAYHVGLNMPEKLHSDDLPPPPKS